MIPTRVRLLKPGGEPVRKLKDLGAKWNRGRRRRCAHKLSRAFGYFLSAISFLSRSGQKGTEICRVIPYRATDPVVRENDPMSAPADAPFAKRARAHTEKSRRTLFREQRWDCEDSHGRC
jgi:hypothetical protein